ncbi:hypothetical protein 1 [Beihai razor shell virus 2]|uniref:hypothetical protein 1 n=1 Tax=Beihai razor shell virus 2 TaxID=1922646 RepID=UPI00090B14D8|nr:hypothetical protein 1 [Beihai razor shell virus 2]APG76697.1 hypothetical protein 1 [Beihai razor shell virus 2]
MLKSTKENRSRLLAQRKKGVRFSVIDASKAHGESINPMYASGAETSNASKAAELNTGNVHACDYAVFNRAEPFVIYMTKMKPYYVLMSTKVSCAPCEEVFPLPRRANPCKICCTMGACNLLLHSTGATHRVSRSADENLFVSQFHLVCTNYWNTLETYDSTPYDFDCTGLYLCLSRDPNTNRRRQPHELFGYYAGGPIRASGDYAFYPNRRYKCPYSVDNKPGRRVRSRGDQVQYDVQALEEQFSDPQARGSHIDPVSEVADVMDMVKCVHKQLADVVENGQVPESHVKLVEDLLIFSYSVYRSKDFFDFSIAIVVLFKLRTNRSVIDHLISILNRLCGHISGRYDIQSNTSFTWFMDVLKSDTYKEIVRVLTILCGLFMMFGNNQFTLDIFDKCERTFKFSPVISGTNIFVDIVSTLSNIYSKFVAFVESGDVNDFFDTSSGVRDFCDRVYNVDRVSKNFPMMTSMCNATGDKWTFHTFAYELHSLLDRAPHIRAVTRGSSNFVKESISKKIQTLNEVNEAFEVFLNSQKFRPAPFSLLVYGGTSIGKSTITRLIQELYAKMVGLPSGQEYCYTLNPHDKYMSSYGMFHHTLVLDDIAVPHPKKLADGDPQLNFLMRVVNNVTFLAPQADVESKGKIPVRVELVIGTTNVKDLASHAHFNVPSAALRRFPFVVSPEVLPQFAVVNSDGSLGTRLDPTRVDGSNDYYSWTVESVIPDGKNVKYEIVLNRGTLAEFVRWMDANVQRHKSAQKLVMESSENFVNIPTCPICGKIEMICICHCDGCGKDKPMCTCGPQVQSEETSHGIEDFPNPEVNSALAFRGFVIGFFLSFVCFLTAAITQFVLDWLTFHVSQIYRTMNYMVRTYDTCHKVMDNVNNRFLQCWITMSRTSQKFVRRIRASCRRSIWGLATFWQGWHLADTQYTVPVILSIISAGAIGYHLYSRKRRYEYQGNGGSKPQMFEADGEADRKNFYVPNLAKGFPIEMSQASRATSSCNVNDVKNMIIGNLHHVTVVANGTYAKANALFVMDNFLVMNNHVLLSDECVIRFDSNPGRIRPLPDAKVIPDMVYRIPDIDICVVRLASLPKRRDISKFLLKEEPKPDGDLIFSGHMFRMPLPAGADDDIRSPEIFKITSARFCHINAKASNDKKLVDRGFKCQLDKETKSGYCGSVSVFNMDSDGNGLIIAGLHHAASGRNTITAPLTYNKFMEAYQTLNDRSIRNINNIVGWSMEASIVNPPIGHDVCRLGSEHRDVHLKPLHPKCPLHWFDDGVFMPIGSHDGIRDSNLRSKVKDFPLRREFEQLGYSSQKVAPELAGWEIHRKALLETVSDNSMSEDILGYVTAAYIKDVIARVPPKEFTYLKPLDDYSSINGVANYSYIDSIVMSTSTGWPFSQKKINYFQRCEPRDGHQFAYEPIPELQRRIDNIYAAYAEGKRAFIVWKAFTKDEPISQAKFDEHRTRHLFCSPVDFSIVTRKYTLTLARLMQRNQFAFETAMGIVAQSSEWTTLYRYLTVHPNNIFGDYVSYDKTMTLCVMRSVFLIIKTLCNHSGNYTPDDIRAISCIEEDTACPLVDFFGDLIMFSGINPSGSPLTTMINCLANCLYMRYAFVVCAENERLPRELVLDFRKYVNLITYGDDNGMCVSDEIPWFTHNNLKRALKSVGVGYTTPDKDKDGCVDYLDISKVDFLSRGFVYNPDVDGFLAPLSDKSMSKMVCHYLKSNSIPEITQVLSILRAFVFESFFQGRVIYERNSAFCQSIIESKYDIYECYPTWDEQVVEWKDRSAKFARIEI